MKSIAKILLLPLLLAAQITHANAEPYVLGGANLNLVPPKGFCVLDKTNLADAQFNALLEDLLRRAQNKLMSTSVECSLLEKFRARQTDKLTDYAAYYTPFMLEGQVFPGDPTASRKAICNEMRKQGSASLDGVKDIVAKKAQEMGQNFGVNSTNYIGVLDEDANGCYAALLVGLRDTKGNHTVMSAIVTSTVVREKMMFLAYYAEYAGPDTTAKSLQASRDAAAALVAANQ